MAINCKDENNNYQTKKINMNKIIPLKADIDADSDKVYWFVDGNFVGSSKKDETILITASSGSHNIVAADDLNRYSYFLLKVRKHA